MVARLVCVRAYRDKPAGQLQLYRIFIQECVGLEADRLDVGTLLRLPFPRNALHRKTLFWPDAWFLIFSLAEWLVAPVFVRRLHVNHVQ